MDAAAHGAGVGTSLTVQTDFTIEKPYRVGRHLVDYLLLTFILRVKPCGQSALPILPGLQLPKQNQADMHNISQLRNKT